MVRLSLSNERLSAANPPLGYGAVLSFETGDKELSERIVGATRLWGISVSFGCVNSLISMPCVMSSVFTFPHNFPSLNSTTYLAMHPSTLLLAQSVVYLKILSDSVLVSKILLIS